MFDIQISLTFKKIWVLEMLLLKIDEKQLKSVTRAVHLGQPCFIYSLYRSIWMYFIIWLYKWNPPKIYQSADISYLDKTRTTDRRSWSRNRQISIPTALTDQNIN